MAVCKLANTEQKKNCENFKIVKSRLYLFKENLFLGASPDTLNQCFCHAEKYLEIKRPF